MQRPACGKAPNRVDNAPELDAEPFPLVGDLHGDALVGNGLTFQHERTQLGKIALRALVTDERRSESEENLALVRRTWIQARAAIDAFG